MERKELEKYGVFVLTYVGDGLSYVPGYANADFETIDAEEAYNLLYSKLWILDTKKSVKLEKEKKESPVAAEKSEKAIEKAESGK